MRIAFLIDAFDRKIIGWNAVANQGIGGSMARDPMLGAVEARFKALHRRRVRLSSCLTMVACYTALETRRFTIGLNPRPCFTPVASPQSNSMAESFVKTLKRDYARYQPVA